MDAISVPGSSILSSALFVREGLPICCSLPFGDPLELLFFFRSVAKVCKDVGKIVLGF